MKRLNLVWGILAMAFLALAGGYVQYNRSKQDNDPPQITMDSDLIECLLDASQEDLIAGMTAIDNKDGDITSHIIVNDIIIREEEENPEKNLFDISYVVFDSSNNMSFASRTLKYDDYYSPRFQIKEPLRFGAATIDFSEIISAEDCIDGDISNQISIEMSKEFLSAYSFGSFECNVSVTNSLGDTSVLPLTFEVVDTASDVESSRPLIYLNEYLVYVKAGKKLNEKSYLDYLLIDNYWYQIVDDKELEVEDTREFGYGYSNKNYGRFIPKSAIKVKSNVDWNTPGIYEVKYSIRHPEEGTKGTAKLMVIVE